MTNAAETPSEFSRITPLVSLLVTILAILWHHQHGVTAGEIYPTLVLFLFLFGGLALAGSIYPPLFYSLGKYGTHLPKSYKVIAAACMFAGCGLGVYVLITLY